MKRLQKIKHLVDVRNFVRHLNELDVPYNQGFGRKAKDLDKMIAAQINSINFEEFLEETETENERLISAIEKLSSKIDLLQTSLETKKVEVKHQYSDEDFDNTCSILTEQTENERQLLLDLFNQKIEVESKTYPIPVEDALVSIDVKEDIVPMPTQAVEMELNIEEPKPLEPILEEVKSVAKKSGRAKQPRAKKPVDTVVATIVEPVVEVNQVVEPVIEVKQVVEPVAEVKEVISTKKSKNGFKRI